MITAALVLLFGIGVAPLVENVPGVKQVQNFVRFGREYLKIRFKGE